ncbi:MAG: hypothetical protein ACJ8AI_33465 [Rhodopila sp.]
MVNYLHGRDILSGGYEAGFTRATRRERIFRALGVFRRDLADHNPHHKRAFRSRSGNQNNGSRHDDPNKGEGTTSTPGNTARQRPVRSEAIHIALPGLPGHELCFGY